MEDTIEQEPEDVIRQLIKTSLLLIREVETLQEEVKKLRMLVDIMKIENKLKRTLIHKK